MKIHICDGISVLVEVGVGERGVLGGKGGGREWLWRGHGMNISRRSDSGHDRVSIMQHNNFHICALEENVISFLKVLHPSSKNNSR